MIAFGFLIGGFGTLIGAGGGFILTPVLLLVYPHESPETITGISLAVVFANATSGSVAYARMKRINYKYGLIFSAAAIPGAILGAAATYHVARAAFDVVFAALLMAASVFLFVRAPKHAAADGHCIVLSRKKLILGIAISVGVGLCPVSWELAVE